ncbi:ATP synthase subunit I [Candidatus Magnetomoraceae bacterium gMMP-15]
MKNNIMGTEKRILKFISITNWILFIISTILSFVFMPGLFAVGILCGGLIVTINFHLLWRTLKKALTPPKLCNYKVVIAKYYVRFTISGLIIFFLISQHYVDPLGLFIGLSVVVASIILATMYELKNFIFKEAI